MVMEMESNGVMGDQVVKEGILEDVTVKHILKAEGEKDRKACQFPSQEQVQFVAQRHRQIRVVGTGLSREIGECQRT